MWHPSDYERNASSLKVGKRKEGVKLDGRFWIDGCFPHGALREAGGRPEGNFTLDGLLGMKEVDAEWRGMRAMLDGGWREEQRNVACSLQPPPATAITEDSESACDDRGWV